MDIKPVKQDRRASERRSIELLILLSAHALDVVGYPEDDTGRPPLDALLSSVNEECAVYCCGPESLIAAVEDWLASLGKAAPPVGSIRSRGTTAIPDRSRCCLLAATQHSTSPRTKRLSMFWTRRVFVPTSCREGTCGSCETRVLCGAIDHRDSLLTKEERQQQDTMMICVSRAAGDAITLDL